MIGSLSKFGRTFLGRYPRVWQHLSRVRVALRPGSLPGRLALANALREAGNSQRAADILKGILELHPECLDAHVSLGWLLTGAGHYTRAQGHYGRALDLFPQSADLLFGFSRVLHAIGNSEQALLHLEQATALKPHLLGGEELARRIKRKITRSRATTVRPNLFIIGAEKSGSTSLYAGLKAHPEIFLSEVKEPGFFVSPHLRRQDVFEDCLNEDEALGAYLDLFRDGESHRYVGEASTQYTMRPGYGESAQAIHQFCADARILYIIRDPVQRTFSDYWWHRQHHLESRLPLQAILEDPHYCDVSNYAMQIRPYLECFSREQIYVLTLEEFSRDPRAELARILRWLDLDPDKARPAAEIRENVSPQEIVFGSKRLHKLAQSPVYRTLRPAIPGLFRRFVRTVLIKPVVPAQVDASDLKAYLRARQHRETQELSELLGRDFPHWKTLYQGTKKAAA